MHFRTLLGVKCLETSSRRPTKSSISAGVNVAVELCEPFRTDTRLDMESRVDLKKFVLVWPFAAVLSFVSGDGETRERGLPAFSLEGKTTTVTGSSSTDELQAWTSESGAPSPIFGKDRRRVWPFALVGDREGERDDG
mmetsp:Transcript_41025/g.60220  ORF Transcript_41025/g.60220 Transcript_41025/m.60220 type:complete len:138 (-) Transcript_41025:573-986(-)